MNFSAADLSDFPRRFLKFGVDVKVAHATSTNCVLKEGIAAGVHQPIAGALGELPTGTHTNARLWLRGRLFITTIMKTATPRDVQAASMRSMLVSG